MSQVVFLVLPQLHLLDLAGPAQVFFTAADLGHDYRLRYVGRWPEMPTAQGLPVRVEVDWPAITPADLIVVPGWRSPTLAGHDGVATLRDVDAAVLAGHHASGGTVASVCSGADVLGRAGLLDGRRCTTHHDLQEELARRYPAATVVRDVLYVVDNRIVTSAGIASGIDLALHLVAGRHGPGAAARVARSMVVYARRNGHERQSSVMLRYRSHLSDVVHRVQDAIDAGFTGPLPLADLARGAGVSQRTLTRLFHEASGMTPLRYQQELRVERAEHLIGHGATTEAAARAVGFRDARMLRRLRARTGSRRVIPGRGATGAPGRG